MNRDEKSYGQMVEDSIWEGEMICDECETVAHCMKNGCSPKTTKKDEALKLALEALEGIHPGNMTPMAEEAWNKAITALRKAIEQAELENRPGLALKLAMAEANDKRLDALKAEQAQPVARVVNKSVVFRPCDLAGLPLNAPLYTAPPPRQPWVGLTEDEKRHLFEREDYQGWLDYINTIEAKLKEKNT